MKRYGLYCLADWMFIAAFVCFLGVKKFRFLVLPIILFLVVGVVVALIQLVFGSTIVYNDSSESVYFKSEEGDDVGRIEPGGKQRGLDGIKYKGLVYKIPNGVHVVVSDSNGVEPLTKIGSALYHIRGGCFDGWQKLFCE